MQTLETLKRRIENAEDLGNVVRTMKTLAAVSIRQYELAVESLRDFDRTIRDGLRMAIWNTTLPPELTDGSTQQGIGAVVFGSEQGMCGQFNESIAEYLSDTVSAVARRAAEPVAIIAVGTRLAARLDDRGLPVIAQLPMAGSAAGISSLGQELLTLIDSWKTSHLPSRILLCYQRRQTAASCQPTHEEFLPVRAEQFRNLQERVWSGRTLPAHSLPVPVLLSRLVRNYLFVRLFRACAESLAAENASRIASMQSAQSSIQERLAELRQDYHQRRQSAITEELLDVVTGFEALTGGSGSLVSQRGKPG